MRIKRFMPWVIVLSAGVPAISGATTAAVAAPTVITACVAKFDGFTRIVAAPGACVARLENVVQFNAQGPAGAQGPQGATGPQGLAGPAGPQGVQGPPGVFLAHTLLVTAGGTPAQNGQLLASTFTAAAALASPANPYLVQLDAGYFDLTGLHPSIAPGISVKGAGMNTTFLTSDSIGLYFVDPTGGTAGNSFQVSDLTVTAGEAIASQTIQTVVLNSVHAVGRIDFYAVLPNVSVLLSNSIVNGAVGLYDNSHDATDRFRIVGTQADSIASVAIPGTLGCFASYNSSLVPYTAACQ